MIAELLIIGFYALLINWLISLHDIYQGTEGRRQKITIIFLALVIGIALGTVSLL